MKNLLLTCLLLHSASTMICMDITPAGSTNESSGMMERAQHNEKVATLLAQIEAKDAAIGAEKLRQAKAVQSLHRRWDLKNALTPAVYTLLIGGKLTYDVYAYLTVQELPSWFNYTNLALDGGVLLYTGGKTGWHLLRACCRRKKIE